MKLGIGLPLTTTTVYTAFLDSWVLMDKRDFVYLRPQFPGRIDDVRNQLVVQALDLDCTHLLMLDTDQTFPENTIERLISHDKFVVTGKVHRRYPPFDPIALRGESMKYLQVEDEEILNNELIEIDATGCGCVLYNTEVFKQISKPWFQFAKRDDGKEIGEDIGFCQKLKANNFNIYMDTTLDIGHISNMEVDWSTYVMYKHLTKLQEKAIQEE